jgi:5-methylcytosine-specific restriction enzyme subunit McrC
MANFTGYICEFGVVREGKNNRQFSSSHLDISTENFDKLEAVLKNSSNSFELDKIFDLTLKRGFRELRIKNFVGYVQVTQDFGIEILPKIFSYEVLTREQVHNSRSLLLRMLKVVSEINFVALHEIDVSTSINRSFFDLFCSNYLDYVQRLLSNGLDLDYVEHISASKFVKGRILLNESMKSGVFSQTSLVCEYDLFTHDLAANRIIKECLVLISRMATLRSNRDKANECLNSFFDVGRLQNIEKEFSDARSKKSSESKYSKLISWSQILLQGSSFSSFQGNTEGFSLLFPMEKLFESYIGILLKRYLPGEVILKDRSHFFAKFRDTEDLELKRNGFFRLEPDILLKNPFTIIDTKWKVLRSTSLLNDVSSSDLYQLFAYGKSYEDPIDAVKQPKLVLLYPYSGNTNQRFSSLIIGGSLNLKIATFDLLSNDPSSEIEFLLNSLR